VAQRNEIRIHISCEGKVRLEVDGLLGPACLELTRGLEECLGEVTERKKKQDFHGELLRVSGLEELSGGIRP
jgi:hypothetical protein